MPTKIHPIQTGFSKGEWSPKVEGRVDLEGYKESAHEITNWVIMPQGGLLTRGGWHFVAETKNSEKESRLIPIQYSELQNYMAEFGDEYIRFYMNCESIPESGGTDPYEITSPYTDTDLWEIRFVQDENNLYLVHPEIQRQQLTRYGHAVWELDEMPSLDGPYMDEVTDVKITPSATTGDVALTAEPVVSTTNLVINGTFEPASNIITGGTPSADTEYSTDYDHNACDGNVNTKWFSTNTSHPHWWAYHLGSSVAIVQYSITVWSSYAPQDWIFEGSTDGVTYVPLDVQSGVMWSLNEKKTFSFTNTTSYAYYRIYITKSYASRDWASLAEVEAATSLSLGSNWTFNSPWTHDTGNKCSDHDSDGTGTLTQEIESMVETFTYKLVFTVSNYTAGTVTGYVGGTAGIVRSANGTYTQYIKATDTTGIAFVPSSNFRGTIDSVELYYVQSGGDIFLQGHIGSVFAIRHTTTTGRVQITAVADGLHASGLVLATLGGVTASDGYRESCWSDQNGYPRIVNFHEGRMHFASTYEQPQTDWASQSYHFNTFTPGVDDDSPYSFTLSVQRIIRWMITARLLCIGCMSGEATAGGANDTPLTATNPPTIKAETTHGSASLQPIKVNRAVLFLQQEERKIREFVYEYNNDAYQAPDITILSDHLFQEGVIDMAYQQEPYSIVWVLTTSGILLGCSYNRESNTLGWFRTVTDGQIESIATIPYNGKDQLWAIIRRNIGGEYKRFVEYLDWDINLDCAMTYEGDPITQMTGLDHLIGKTVSIVADNAYVGDQVVTPGGTVNLTSPASSITVGLPFRPKLVSSRPEINTQTGTSQGLMKSWKKIWLRLLNSKGLTVQGQPIPTRTTEDEMGQTSEAFSRDFPVEGCGYDRDGRITVEQILPMRSFIVCMFGDLMVGDS